MNSIELNRRDFVKAMTVIAGAGLVGSHAPLTRAETAYPFSAGFGSPALKVPPLACDCHHHIYDRAYPYVDDRNLPTASVADYLKLRSRLGLSRSIAIQPSSYGTDNSCLIAALAQLGSSSRGIAVVDDKVDLAELKRLDAAGIRGLRFNLGVASVTTPEMIKPLAHRIADLGWHLEIHMRADELLGMKEILSNLPVQIVFDHFGRIPHPAGIDHPAYALIVELVSQDRAWVKISGAYQDSVLGGPAYEDIKSLAQTMIELAPNRVIWGTDWPHPSLQTKRQAMPDDAGMMDLLSVWTRNGEEISKILVDNPTRLYGF
ncbi:amidohydrolase family protein [Pseudomonas sp. PS01301]|uniref:amidohydrolase family protein n=1 Tax=Pseudomonas sp. PS01301 TaxID=2991437 RepID=UPI00249CE9E4|nr:amidohydrolase family protein [Pseudomonas sp. PS01301]